MIKILYELEKKEQAPFTHNIYRIYQQLKDSTRGYLENIMTKQENEPARRFTTSIKQ